MLRTKGRELLVDYPIPLLSVEGKISFAVIARRMTSYMIANKYLDTRVQKGGVPGMSGCVEHTATLTQLVREAKQAKGGLTIVWLDLTNAYGSIPHKVLEEMLKRYHVPGKVQELLRMYYSNFYLRFS